MENSWPGKVCNQTINLFNKWVERHTTQGLRSTFIRSEKRYLVEKTVTNSGRILLEEKILEGFVGIRGNLNSPKPWTDVDEFGAIFNEELPSNYRTIILGAEDPFNELTENKEEWRKFLKFTRTYNIRNFKKSLKESFIALQKILERRGMVTIMTGKRERELHGWDQISSFLGRSIPSTMSMAKDPEMKLPITVIGKTPFSTEEKLIQWKKDRLENSPLWKENGRSKN